MDYRDFHPEDVKAAIRKRFGSLEKFEKEHGLFRGAVTDVLRGRTSARVAAIMNAALVMEAATVAPRLTDISVSRPKLRRNHRLNSKAA